MFDNLLISFYEGSVLKRFRFINWFFGENDLEDMVGFMIGEGINCLNERFWYDG